MEELKQYYAQVAQALAAVREVTTRIDERMNTLVTKLDAQEILLDKLADDMQEIGTRVAVLEAKKDGVERMKDSIKDMNADLHRIEVKVAALEIHHQRHTEGKWAMLGDWGIRLMWATAAVLVIYRLGFSALPLQ